MTSSAEQWSKNREVRINDAVTKNPELVAFFQASNNPHFNQAAISNFVDNWNQAHPKFSQNDLNSSISKTYEAKRNATITVWVSDDGKIRMMANY